MLITPLINTARLQQLILAESCLVVDCRFALTDPEKGRSDWLEAHIPGARYAHLNDDLSAPVTSLTGRHPLPDPAAFADFLASIGWSPGQLLVAYDDASNAFASRLWWLMRYFNQSAALLDGGFAAWTRAGYATESVQGIMQASYPEELVVNPEMTVSAEDVMGSINYGGMKILDARAPERFSGEVEPLDTKAGHIPGAMNRPFDLNLDENGCFKKPAALREEFDALLGTFKPEQIANSCGSGVTACHNAFAMELAGLTPTKLYPGSWSEWIRNPDRPIETGN